MRLSPLAVLKARFSFPVDCAIDEQSEKELAAKGYVGSKLQRLVAHRRALLTFMAIFYTVAFCDRIWTLNTEFKTLNDVRRCPESGQTDVLSKSLEQLLSVAPAFGGSRWGECEADHYQYRYNENCTETGEAGEEVCVDVKAAETTCIGRPNDQLAIVTPFSQFIKVIDENAGDSFLYTTETSSADPPVGFTINDSIFALGELMVYWLGDDPDNPVYPECATNYATVTTFTNVDGDGLDYNIKCFTNATMGGGFDSSWYVEQVGATNTYTDANPFTSFDTVVAYTSSTKVSTAATCGGAYPTMSRPCCTSEEVLKSAKNPAELVDIRKNISIVNLVLSGVSMLSAWIATYKWDDMRRSQFFAAASWVAPFVVSCFLAMMPLAYLADMDGKKVFNDVLNKNLEFADIDDGIKFMNAVTPASTDEYGSREGIIVPILSFRTENKVYVEDVSNTAIDIEFRLTPLSSAPLHHQPKVSAFLFPLTISPLLPPQKEKQRKLLLQRRQPLPLGEKKKTQRTTLFCSRSRTRHRPQ